jgi:hypothetical protein
MDVSIRRKFANEVTEYSRFYISLDPMADQNTLVHNEGVRDPYFPPSLSARI